LLATPIVPALATPMGSKPPTGVPDESEREQLRA
jgi:hypothetical protein